MLIQNQPIGKKSAVYFLLIAIIISAGVINYSISLPQELFILVILLVANSFVVSTGIAMFLLVFLKKK